MIIEHIRLCGEILEEWIMRSGEDNFSSFSFRVKESIQTISHIFMKTRSRFIDDDTYRIMEESCDNSYTITLPRRKIFHSDIEKSSHLKSLKEHIETFCIIGCP